MVACPSGWHLPSDAEWNVLMKFANPSCSDNATCAGAGTKLKSTSGWNTGSGYIPGTDDYDFSAAGGAVMFAQCRGSPTWLPCHDVRRNAAMFAKGQPRGVAPTIIITIMFAHCLNPDAPDYRIGRICGYAYSPLPKGKGWQLRSN
ncbi:MAG: hypothetical protein LBH25_05090 [Fibromonadaceae bacterium]|jgi:hypothetical protein|nr:hypothetical protein [Fibromonadaceae bacterium]